MGCVTFRDDEASKISKKIDAQIKQDRRRRERDHIVNILLLGPGESGKSTIFKQMKIIQDGGGFSDAELVRFRHVVFTNCISQMRVLVTAVVRKKQPFQNPDSVQFAKLLASLPEAGNVWTPEVGFAIKSLWADKGIRDVYKSAGKSFHLNDTASFFFDNVDRYVTSEYVPTIDDVLRVRVMSTGIEEAEFGFENTMFKVIDVGGQRAERRKWVHCFECVTGVVFCVSLNGYYQTLREDNVTNRMSDAFMIFDETVNNPIFSDTIVILFLNKIDLFREKIRDIPLTTCPEFVDFTEGADYDAAVNFVKGKFLEHVKRNGRQSEVRVHFTCALDTTSIEIVINDMRHVVMNKIAGEIVIM